MFFICENIGDFQGAIYTYRKFSSWLPKEKLTPENEKLKYSYARALTLYIVRNLLARVYKEQNRIEDTIKEYSSLAKGKESQEKVLAYCEIIKIGLELSDKDLIKKYYEKCKSIVSEFVESTLETFDIFYILAKGAKELGKIKETKAYYMEALVVGRVLKNLEKERVAIIGELFEVLDKSDFYSVQSIEVEYLELLKTTKDYQGALKILDYYRKYLPNELPQKFDLFLK